MRKSPKAVIDAHVHCGVIDRTFRQSFEDYRRETAGSDISGVALFSPVYEIYDRYDAHFTDTPTWRRRRRESNAHLLTLTGTDLTVFPYFFIWNDFAVEQLVDAHCGIKWHRHDDEPVYRYDDPKCRIALEEIRLRNLPVVLEEEFQNTRRFIEELADGITVIVPHLGLLNRLQVAPQRPFLIFRFHPLPTRREPVHEYARFTGLHERRSGPYAYRWTPSQ